MQKKEKVGIFCAREIFFHAVGPKNFFSPPIVSPWQIGFQLPPPIFQKNFTLPPKGSPCPNAINIYDY